VLFISYPLGEAEGGQEKRKKKTESIDIEEQNTREIKKSK